MNKENIIHEILTGVATAFDELDLPKQPYGRNELWEGITDYFKIKAPYRFFLQLYPLLYQIANQGKAIAIISWNKNRKHK